MSTAAQIDAALAPLRARLAAASLLDAVGGGARPQSTTTTPTTLAATARPPSDVAVLDHDQTIGDALNLLARRRILSAPLVVNPATAADDDEDAGGGREEQEGDEGEGRPPSLLGWVGLREVVLALREHLEAAAARSGRPLPTHMLALMTALRAETPKFLQRPLVALRDAGDSGLVYQADGGAPLLDAVRDVLCAPPPAGGEEGGEGMEEDGVEEKEEAQAGGGAGAGAGLGAWPTAAAAAAAAAPAAASSGEHGAAAAAAAAAQRRRSRSRRRGVHRLAVFDARGRLTHVVSQLDVVRFMHLHCAPELAAASALTLRQLGLHPPRPGRPLVTLQPHTPTLLALERMAREGVNGAAVVGPRGDIVANLSLSDCRCMRGAKDLAALALPVAEFLALSHGTSYLGYSAGARLAGGAAAGGAGGGSFSGGAAGASPTFFAAAARAAAARHVGGAGGGPAADNAPPPPSSPSPPPASPAFGAGGSPYGGPSGLARMSSGGGSARGGGGPSSSSGGTSAPAQAAEAAAAAAAAAAAGREGRGASPTGDEAAVAEEADHVVRLITASPDASLAEVVALMCRHRVHRVYLVEPQQQQQQQPQQLQQQQSQQQQQQQQQQRQRLLGDAGLAGAAAAAAGGSGGDGGAGVPGAAGRVTGVVTPTDILDLLAGARPASAAAAAASATATASGFAAQMRRAGFPDARAVPLEGGGGNGFGVRCTLDLAPAESDEEEAEAARLAIVFMTADRGDPRDIPSS